MQGTQRAGEREGERARDRARDAMTCMWLAVHDTQGSLSISLSVLFLLPSFSLSPRPISSLSPTSAIINVVVRQATTSCASYRYRFTSQCVCECLCVCVCVWRNWYKQLPRATIRGFVMQEHVSGRCNCTIKQINYTYKTHTHTYRHTHTLTAPTRSR